MRVDVLLEVKALLITDAAYEVKVLADVTSEDVVPMLVNELKLVTGAIEATDSAEVNAVVLKNEDTELSVEIRVTLLNALSVSFLRITPTKNLKSFEINVNQILWS